MDRTNSLAEQLAEMLLRIGAVVLRPNEPFTWTSGLKSPIYCDNRLTISYPEIREWIADRFAAIIAEEFPGTEVIAGAATGGIPHAAWVAQKLNLPMIYVRDKAKGHGKQNRIEGVLRAGQKTVVIEDLISTGGSSLKVAEAVNEAGGRALGVAAIFTYEFAQTEAAFAEAGIPVRTLSSYSALIETAVASGKIGQQELDLLRSWKADPQQFGK